MRALTLLLFITACASVEKNELSTLSELSAPECAIDQRDLRRPVFAQTASGIGTFIGSTGSAALATVGYATDVVIVLGPAVLVAAACAEGNGCNGNVGDVAVSGMRAYAETEFQGFGNLFLDSTESWRCPHVDHIAKAFRRAARCNAKKGHYSAAYAHLDFLERDETLKKCTSEVEKLLISGQREQIKAFAVPSQKEEADPDEIFNHLEL